MSEIITVKALCKTFKVNKRKTGFLSGVRSLVAPQALLVQAVRQVDFSLQPGELVGYIGPNGAGKSTTLKMLTGLLVPTSGKILVNGFVPWKERTKYVSGIGAVFGQRTTLWWDLPVIDSFEMCQAMYRIPMERFRKNMKEFTEMLEMGDFLNSPVRSLSLGQRMRADLCAALLHEPPLLFLDEPTIGLDVVAKERIRQFILRINREQGTTVILTTHDLADIEKLCQRVMILDQGSLLYDGRLDKLVDQFEQERVIEVRFSQTYANIDLPGITPSDIKGDQAKYKLSLKQLPGAMQFLMAHFDISDLEVHQPELESTIRRIYEQQLLLEAAL